MKILKERTFNVDIVSVITGLLLLTVFLITSFVYVRNREDALKMARESFSREARSVISKTTNHLRAAQVPAEIATELLKDSTMPLGLGTKLEAYFLKVVAASGPIDLFYYGNEQGDFLQAAQFEVSDSTVTYTKYLKRTPEKTVTTFHYLDADLRVQREEIVVDEGYDPRVRPWYRGAERTRTTYWTDPYIFHENAKPGITVACPVYDDGENLLGVVGADMTLEGLSRFLRDFEDEGMAAFIIDEVGRLVAYPDPHKMVAPDGGTMRNLRPEELRIPEITMAMRHRQDTGQTMFGYRAGEERFLAFFSSFPTNFHKAWTIVIVAPERKFLGPLKDTLRETLVRSSLLLLVSVLIGVFLARQISRPIELLTDEVLGVKDFDLETRHEIRSHIVEIRTMNSAIKAMKQSLKAFRLYVPATLVRRLIASGEEIRIGGKDRELTIFFSDIEGFTAIAESLPPRDLMVRLSDYFDRISGVIDRQQGTLDKFIGDAVMAFWGAPVMNDEHAVLACRAALECRREIEELNRQWREEGKPPFETRIGLHTGYATVGNMGSRQRMNYSVVGDSVNLASRLESVNKIYGTRIIISNGTHRYAQGRFVCRILDQISVMGKSRSVTIYELLAEADTEEAARYRPLADRFNDAYAVYLERKWAEAKTMFEGILQDFPEDRPCRIYIERCEKYLLQEPDADWSGVTRLSRK